MFEKIFTVKTSLIIFVCIILLASCTKCVKCTETSKGGDTTIVEYPETCGNWRKLAKFEERVHEQALKGNDVVCKPKSKIPLINE